MKLLLYIYQRKQLITGSQYLYGIDYEHDSLLQYCTWIKTDMYQA